jgi:hypothetical protein
LRLFENGEIRMITLTAEQAQQIEETLVLLCKTHPEVNGGFIVNMALNNIRAARAQEQAEQDLDTCPGCGGVADNGHDREFPPNPYYCTKCSEQAEQEPFDMDDHPPHRLCECRKCMEYFTPLPDCDAFAASGKPIAGQTNTQLMEGFRPVSEMIAEHKQDPKKAAAIEKAKMRKAEQEPAAWRNYNGAVNNRLKTAAPQPVQKPTDCPCCGAKGTVIPSAFCRECKSDFWPPSVPANPTQPD